MISEIPREEPEDDIERLVKELQATPLVEVPVAFLELLVDLAVASLLSMSTKGLLQKLPPQELYSLLAPIAWASEKFPENLLIKQWEATMDAMGKEGESPG